MSPQLIAAYVIGSALVGFVGRRRRIGFVGFFVVSLLVTPFVSLILLFITTPRITTARGHQTS